MEIKEVLGILDYSRCGYDFAANTAETKEERLFLTGCYTGVNGVLEVIEKKLNEEII